MKIYSSVATPLANGDVLVGSIPVNTDTTREIYGTLDLTNNVLTGITEANVISSTEPFLDKAVAKLFLPIQQFPVELTDPNWTKVYQMFQNYVYNTRTNS